MKKKNMKTKITFKHIKKKDTGVQELNKRNKELPINAIENYPKCIGNLTFLISIGTVHIETIERVHYVISDFLLYKILQSLKRIKNSHTT